MPTRALALTGHKNMFQVIDIQAWDNFDRYLIPPGFEGQAVVAGGAVVSYDLAQDIDLWFLVGPDLRQCATQIKTFIRDRGTEILDDPSHEVEYKMANGRYVKLGRVELDNLKPIQLFVVPYETPADLLDCFDVTTHMVAMSPFAATRYTLTQTTAPGDMAGVHAWKTPQNTLRRYFKISERYQQPIDWAVIDRLCLDRAKQLGNFKEADPNLPF